MSPVVSKLEKILEEPPIEVLVLAVTLFLYILLTIFLPSKEFELLRIFFAALIAFEIVLFVGLEIKTGVKKHGWKHEVVDTIMALLIAVALWVSATVVLNTSSPISAVVSCSMLPNLERGDFVIVQGGDAAGYDINMSREEFSLFNDRISTVFDGNSTYTLDAPLYYHCVKNRDTGLCTKFMSRPDEVVEVRGPFEYHYTVCSIDYTDGSRSFGPCLESVSFHGREYLANFSHDVIVYAPQEGDLFGSIGDIIHRVYFRINVDGDRYYITKGDNNPVLDIQVYDTAGRSGNSPVSEDHSRGRVIARVPYLGYFKLFISGYWKEDSQCHMELSYPHH